MIIYSIKNVEIDKTTRNRTSRWPNKGGTMPMKPDCAFMLPEDRGAAPVGPVADVGCFGPAGLCLALQPSPRLA